MRGMGPAVAGSVRPMINGLSARAARWQRRRADEAIAQLRRDVETLGIGPVPAAVRIALRARFQKQVATWLVSIPLALVVVVYLLRLVTDWIVNGAPAEFGYVHGDGSTRADVANTALLFAPSIILILATRGVGSFVGAAFNLPGHTFGRLETWAALIKDCAEIYRAPGRVRPTMALPSLRHALLSVHGASSMRGSIPRTALRRRLMARRHAVRVVASLRSASAELDVDPRAGAVKVGRLALKISERYAEGRVGALLDENELVHRSRYAEALQLVLAAMAVAGLVALAKALGLPDLALAAAVVIVVTLVYRHSVMRGVELLAVLVPLMVVVQ